MLGRLGDWVKKSEEFKQNEKICIYIDTDNSVMIVTKEKEGGEKQKLKEG